MNTKQLITTNQEDTIMPVKYDAESLIAQAIDKNVPVETMERLLAMRRELKAEYAKEAYDRAMAKFQSECPTIQKRKHVSFNTTNYSYAPLEDIVEQVKDLLAENGFSYTFDTKQTDNAMKMYCKVKHLDGHMEVSEFEIALDTQSKMNVSQRYGSASSYGKRYAFCNAFGILTGDEDTDVRSPHLTSHKEIEGKEVQNPTTDFVREPYDNGYTKPATSSTSSTGNKCPVCRASGKYHRPDCPNKS